MDTDSLVNKYLPEATETTSLEWDIENEVLK